MNARALAVLLGACACLSACRSVAPLPDGSGTIRPAVTAPEPSATSPDLSDPSAATVPSSTAPPSGPETLHERPTIATPSVPVRLRSGRLREASGLAVSGRDAGVLWAIDDGGNAPLLHAFAHDGRALGRWPIEARNRDWEDLAAVRIDGVPHLLIADTGDNLRRREDYALHLVVEPAIGGADDDAPAAATAVALTPRRTLRFRYEDGAHDVEAVAVDAPSGTIWLLTKEPAGGAAGGAYTLALDADAEEAGALPVARRAATLAPVPRTFEGRLAAALAGVDLEQPTAFDIAPDGRSACLLSYRRVRCFERSDGESWATRLARPGRTLATHGLAQAESLALSADGRLWITSEGRRPPLLSLMARPGPS